MMCPALGCWMLSVLSIGKSEGDKAAAKHALLRCCQPASRFRMESGNVGGGGNTILRGLQCLFCFHAVFRDDLKSTAKLAFCWFGEAALATLVPKASLGFRHRAAGSPCHPAPLCSVLRGPCPSYHRITE